MNHREPADPAATTVDHPDAGADRRRVAGIAQGAVLILGGMLPTMAVIALVPALPALLRHFAHARHAQLIVPLMISAPGLMVAVLAPLAGQVIDRLGRRNILLLAGLVYPVAGVAPFFLDALTPTFACRIAVGVAEAFILTGVNALIGDYFEERGRRTLLATQAFVMPVLTTLLLMLAGRLTGWVWDGSFLVYLLALPVFLGFAGYVFEPPRAGRRPVRAEPVIPAFGQVLRISGGFGLSTLLASVFFFACVIQGAIAFEAIGVASPQRIGVLLGIANLGSPAGAIVFALLGKTAPKRLASVVFGMIGVGLLLMGVARTGTGMTGAMFVAEIGAGMLVATFILWAHSVLPADWRGRGMGLWCSCFYLGEFLAPVAFAAARAATGRTLGAFALLGVASMVCGVAVLVSAGRRPAARGS